LLFPFKLMSMKSLAGVDEWKPIDSSKPGPFEISLLATLIICLVRGVKVPAVRLLLLLGLLHMAFSHNRHVMVAAPVSALVLAPRIARSADGSAPAPARAAPWLAWIAVAAAVLALIGVRAVTPVAWGDGPSTPASALAHVPPEVRAQPVFNGYGMGGYLIFSGVRPFVDGRTDLYGDAFMARYQAIAGGDAAAFDQEAAQRRIAWTILSPDSPLVGVLDHEAGWRRLYADRYAIVHVRKS
jgi:hypothetical protein